MSGIPRYYYSITSSPGQIVSVVGDVSFFVDVCCPRGLDIPVSDFQDGPTGLVHFIHISKTSASQL